MSTSSGITSSQELLDAFKSLQSGGLVVKISAQNTELVPAFETGSSSSTESTFEQLNKFVSKEFPQPSYSIIHTGDQYIFISLIPDVAPIKQKMLYASSKSTLINSLGAIFPTSFAWTELSEFNWKHYQEEVASLGLDGPLTADEKTLKEINSLQTLSLNNFKKPLASMQGNILFQFSPDLSSALESFGSNGELVVFNIDTKTEEFTLTAKYDNVEIKSLVSKLELTLEGPQCSVYNYAEGKNAFLYVCPSGSKVKDRMLYASSKVSLVSYLKKNLNIEKSIEVGDLDEIELSELEQKEEVSVSSNALKFNKPKGPRRR